MGGGWGGRDGGGWAGDGGGAGVFVVEGFHHQGRASQIFRNPDERLILFRPCLLKVGPPAYS